MIALGCCRNHRRLTWTKSHSRGELEPRFLSKRFMLERRPGPRQPPTSAALGNWDCLLQHCGFLVESQIVVLPVQTWLFVPALLPCLLHIEHVENMVCRAPAVNPGDLTGRICHGGSVGLGLTPHPSSQRAEGIISSHTASPCQALTFVIICYLREACRPLYCSSSFAWSLLKSWHSCPSNQHLCFNKLPKWVLRTLKFEKCRSAGDVLCTGRGERSPTYCSSLVLSHFPLPPRP